MTSKTLTISAPEEMLLYLADNPDLSPSKIFQMGLTNIMEEHKISRERVLQLTHAKERVQKNLLVATNFIEKKGLWEEFLKEDGLGFA